MSQLSQRLSKEYGLSWWVVQGLEEALLTKSMRKSQAVWGLMLILIGTIFVPRFVAPYWLELVVEAATLIVFVAIFFWIRQRHLRKIEPELRARLVARSEMASKN